MKTPRNQPALLPSATLRRRLAEAEETIRAIRSGEVDAIASSDKNGPQVFTLGGANHPYRVLIESMNEGALTLTNDKTILFANRCFARMVKCPLEQVTGGSFRRYLPLADRDALRSLIKMSAKSGSKLQVSLQAGDGTLLPVQISVREIAKSRAGDVVIGMVVTDMTEARRAEEILRALTQRVVDVQEAERERVALELHDNITQLLVAVLFRSQALADSLTTHDRRAKKEALQLRALLGQTVEEVQRIAQNLRPSILDQLGLVATLRATCTEFANRTRVGIDFSGAQPTTPLPAASELALFRILQEALKNVQQHAHARHVTVRLIEVGAIVLLAISDDGIGFDPARRPARRKGKARLGLLSIHERARYVGGAFSVKSGRGTGTTIEVRLPLPSP